MRGFFAALWFFAAFLAAVAAQAHSLRTAFVDVEEHSPGRAVVRVRTTVSDPSVKVDVSGACESAPASEDSQGALSLTCHEGLIGARFSVTGLGPVHSEAVIAISFVDGSRVSHLVTSVDPSWTVPGRTTWLSVAKSYVGFGIRHIFTGPDHLLFLALLVFALRRPRAVLIAETAFTVSHSLSFSATVLGFLHVPTAAAEACIGLSLLLVALDIGRENPIDALRGAAMAFVFGIVHGLGFAGGLHEIGLPDQDAALALVGFGAGVEIGQVAFLLLALSAFRVLRGVDRLARLAPAGTAVLGGIAAYFLIDRVSACFGFWH